MKQVVIRVMSVLVAALLLAGCGGGIPGVGQEADVIVYSGRSKALVDPLIERFEQETGLNAEVRYGKDAALLAGLKMEGKHTPADLLWANTVGALVAASDLGMLSKLPEEILARPGADAYVPENGRWVPITMRFRVLAYNTKHVDPEQLPDSVMELPELTRFTGRVGWTPAYSSFQDFITAMRLVHGRKATKQWLQGMKALNPKSYTQNTPMIRALAAGALDIALTNHYYVMRIKYGGAEGEFEGFEAAERRARAKKFSPDAHAPIEIYHFESGDVGNLALVTGMGVLKYSDNRRAALRLLKFFLSKPAQRFAARKVHEYPVVPGVQGPEHMMSLEESLKISPDIEFTQLADLRKTTQLLREVGLP